MAEALFRTLHLVAVIGLAAGSLIVALGTAASISKDDLAGLIRIYVMTGVSVLIAIAGGLVLWFYVGKPAAFFSGNPVFHMKLGLFVFFIALLLYPVWHLRLLQGQDFSTAGTVSVPRTIMICQKLALLPLLVMPVLAYLMARGIGY